MGVECGRVETICRSAGMPTIEDDALVEAFMAPNPGCAPVACVPAWAQDGSREAMFAKSVVDILIAQRGEDALIHCLREALRDLSAQPHFTDG